MAKATPDFFERGETQCGLRRILREAATTVLLSLLEKIDEGTGDCPFRSWKSGIDDGRLKAADARSRGSAAS